MAMITTIIIFKTFQHDRIIMFSFSVNNKNLARVYSVICSLSISIFLRTSLVISLRRGKKDGFPSIENDNYNRFNLISLSVLLCYHIVGE